MTYVDTITYEYADAEKTVVRRTAVNYHDLTVLQAQVEEINAKLVALPQEKEVPDAAAFTAKWAQTGLTRAEVQEMFDHYNMNAVSSRQREDLEARKRDIEEHIKRLRAETEGTEKG